MSIPTNGTLTKIILTILIAVTLTFLGSVSKVMYGMISTQAEMRTADAVLETRVNSQHEALKRIEAKLDRVLEVVQ